VKKARPIKQSGDSAEQAAVAAESAAAEELVGEEASAESEEGLDEPQADGEVLADEEIESDGEVRADADIPADGDLRADGENAQPVLPHLLPSPAERRGLLEAIVYVAEEPLAAAQIATGLGLPEDVIHADLEELAAETQAAARGIEIRKVAGGYKMFTKAEHHDTIRQFVKTLRPKLRLSLPALETLAVIAYKQPVTVPEIQAIRGVNAGGVIHTLLNHKLITTAGRKKVIGRPMQYKTTKEFLVQFGLNDLTELPNLKELEELSRAALGEGEEPEQAQASGTDPGENGAGTSASGTEESAGEADFGDATDDSAVEEDSEDSIRPTAAAAAAAAGAGRAGSTPLDDDSEEESET
jgi:segregation and condensation protein B